MAAPKKKKKPLNEQQRQVRDQKVWNLRIEGYSQWDIAQKIKISRSRVQQIINSQFKEISEKNSETREAMILMDLQRIDMLIQKSCKEIARSEAGKQIVESSTTEKHYTVKSGEGGMFSEELQLKTETASKVKEVPPEVDPALIKAINSLIDQRHKLLGTYDANKKIQDDDGPKDEAPKQYELKISLPDGSNLAPIHNYNDLKAMLNEHTQQDPHKFNDNTES